MAKKSKTNITNWFLLGLVGTLIAAPNATVVKYGTDHMDPFLFNTLRFLIVSMVTSPFVLVRLGSLRKVSVRSACLAGLCMTIAVISYVLAIKYSQASYVATISLITPIIFIIYSARMTGEKITSRAVAGITLAAIGAMIIVALPIAIHQGASFVFYPAATGWALLSCLTFPLAMIYMKRANESGMSMPAILSITYWIACLVNLACFALVGTGSVRSIDHGAVFGIVYSGIAVALVARMIGVLAYEHIGSAITSALAYLETFLAILLPVALLHEHLSVEMVAGGILILCGVYVVEHHKSKSHRHYHAFRLH